MIKEAVLAVDLGGTKTQIGCFVDGVLLGTNKFQTPSLAKDFEILLESESRVLLTRHGLSPEDLMGIGVAAAGYWDSNYLLKQSIHLAKYINQPIWSNISASLDLPVALRSDVELAAIGEALHGQGLQQHRYDSATQHESSNKNSSRICESLLYVNMGTGFSGALFKDGQIFSTDYSPTIRLEYLVQADFSANALSSRALSQGLPEKTTDGLAQRSSQIAALSTTLVNLACVLAPKLIVLGGGKTKDDNWDLIIRPAIDKALEYLDQHMTYSIKISRAKLENPALYGAYELVKHSKSLV